ncbi:tetratricopeptide repeat protein [Dysgonomonas sp. 521]|uniref:tetratricopeptide repeat protein n=1 Tax=Dysgonomonas sp. 521 TaxID=2302932 RepID=UPI0013D46272|nr:tetratricopeptide repeat protein [Dysgonomonas sp. 521]NDV95400.1 tetratricopeptide repeat protein [Dysgonomonas sp. 521]
MKSIFIYLLLSVCCAPAVLAQTLNEAKELYLRGEYAKALPIFEAEYNAKPDDASLNQWYGVCLLQTGKNLPKAEECLLVASKKRIPESFLYLGQLYAQEYRFTESDDAFGKYEASLKKKDDAAREKLEEKRKVMSRIRRMASNTEDVQIIDSIIIDKQKFLSAYTLSLSSGKLDYFDKLFTADRHVDATAYTNEKGTKMYYAKPEKDYSLALYSQEKLLDEFGNEKKLSASNFGLSGDVNYPYMMADGVTIYFAAKDEDSLGGYDLFVSRYNMNNDTYLTPERLNMPFNSLYNDYMMAVDEEKGVGWFASDRYMPNGKVCVYTFIPNKVVKIIQSDDEEYLSRRARISSIKDSWVAGQNYTSLIASARKEPVVKTEVIHDFEFVIDDDRTYYKLADFKSRAAQTTFSKVIQLQKEFNDLSVKLDKQRSDYSSASQDGKRRMSSEIYNLEKRVEQLRTEIPEMEIQARNQEINNL